MIHLDVQPMCSINSWVTLKVPGEWAGESARSSAPSQSWSLDIQGLVKDRYYDDEWAAVGMVCVAVRISFCFPSISGERSASSHPRDLRKPVPLLSNECGIISSDLKVVLTLCSPQWFGATSFQKREHASSSNCEHALARIFGYEPWSSRHACRLRTEAANSVKPLVWKSPPPTFPPFSIRGMLVQGQQDWCSDQIYICIVVIVIKDFKGNTTPLCLMEPLSVHSELLPLEGRVTSGSHLCKPQMTMAKRMDAEQYSMKWETVVSSRILLRYVCPFGLETSACWCPQPRKTP